MTKMRVHELAKELGIENKELIKILQSKNVEVKNHMSSLEDSMAVEIRREHSERKTEKPEPKKEETEAETAAKADAGKADSTEAKEAAPKKKNLAFVIRPQNSKNSSRIQGSRPAQRPARPGQQGTRPAQRARPAQQGARPAQGTHPAGERPARTERPAQGLRPAGEGRAPGEGRPSGDRPVRTERPVQNARPAGEGRPAGETRSEAERPVRTERPAQSVRPADRQETVRHVLRAPLVLTDPRAAALLVKEGRAVRTEEIEAGAIRDRAYQGRAETGEIPAGKMWELLS